MSHTTSFNPGALVPGSAEFEHHKKLLEQGYQPEQTGRIYPKNGGQALNVKYVHPESVASGKFLEVAGRSIAGGLGTVFSLGLANKFSKNFQKFNKKTRQIANDQARPWVDPTFLRGALGVTIGAATVGIAPAI